jgi:hypothetical protein
MDATWRTYDYFTYPSPTPSVILIKAMLPEAVPFFQEKKVTKLLTAVFWKTKMSSAFKILWFS